MSTNPTHTNPRRADEPGSLASELLEPNEATQSFDLDAEPTQVLPPAPDRPNRPDVSAQESAESPSQPTISARGLSLQGPRGLIYHDVSLEVPTGEVTALVGAQGSGRTSILLTLAGRMAFSSGSLRVLNHDLPRGRRDVQRHAALAHFEGIDELDEGLTLGELVAERAGLCVPLWRRPMRTSDPELIDLATTAFFPGLVPGWDTPVWQLTPLQEFQARLLIAMIGGPRVLVVDNLDAIREPNDQVLAWTSVQRLAQRGVAAVVASTNEDTIPADVTRVRLATNPDVEA